MHHSWATKWCTFVQKSTLRLCWSCCTYWWALLHARVLRTEVYAWCIGVSSNIPCCHLPCNRRVAGSRIYTNRPVDGPETSRILETECGLACVAVSECYCCHNGFGTTTQRPGANICREINTGVSMHIISVPQRTSTCRHCMPTNLWRADWQSKH